MLFSLDLSNSLKAVNPIIVRTKIIITEILNTKNIRDFLSDVSSLFSPISLFFLFYLIIPYLNVISYVNYLSR